MPETPVDFTVDGHRLFGTLHLRESGSPQRDRGMVFQHGWSGNRSGPHRMFVKMARLLAAEGYPSLRFDFRGRGDSEGGTEAATLWTMMDDTAEAARLLADRAGVTALTLIGICSGSEVALGAATRHPAVDSLVLWSPPIFSAEITVAREARKKAHYAREYLGKLFRPETWRKVLSGAVQTKVIAKVLFGKSDKAQVQAAQSAALRDITLKAFRKWRGDVFLVYGTNDPTTTEALAWHEDLFSETGLSYRTHIVEGSNHSYYSLDWEAEVLRESLAFLKGLGPHDQGSLR